MEKNRAITHIQGYLSPTKYLFKKSGNLLKRSQKIIKDQEIQNDKYDPEHSLPHNDQQPFSEKVQSEKWIWLFIG